AIRRIVRSVGQDVPVLGVAGAPWTLACYMVEGKAKEGFATVKSFLYHEPKTFRVLLHRIAQATIPYLKAQIAAGATAVQLFDTWGGELNLQDYEDFALPAVQEIISGLDGSAPVIYYTKASQHLLPAAARSGANALSVDWRVDLAEIRKLLGPKIALQGNVDPAVLFAPPEKIRDATLGTISSLCGRGHILNLGHGILQNTPVENDTFGPADLERVHAEAERARTPVSLYMHIPFCESLCLFCACNVVIQKNKSVAPPYLDVLKQEMKRIGRSVSRNRPVVQFHWGGGTPTYLSHAQLEHLFTFTREHFHFDPNSEIGIEVDL